MVIVAGTRLLPVHPVLGQDRLELLGDRLRHLLVSLLPGDEDAAGVVEDGEAATPEHQGVVWMGPGHEAPVLRLTNQRACCMYQPMRGQQ